MAQLAHRSWGDKEGYPGLAYAITQTKDGFIWLGVPSGLYRFDGVSFEHYEPASVGKSLYRNVVSLLALPDGRLWIGYISGQVGVLQNGTIKIYGKADGVPDGGIWKIAQDRDGNIWIATDNGLTRFDGHRWEEVGARWNCPKKQATALFVDSHGTLWAAIGHSILFLKQGLNRFEDTGEFALSTTSIAEAPDGKIWMADTQMAVRPIGMPGSPRLATARCAAAAASKGMRVLGPACNSASQLEIQFGSSGILFDRNGSLWITTLGDGLRRSPFPLRLKNQPIGRFSDALESFTSKDGLSADYSFPIFEDREGNIWVGTQNGLDEFHDSALVPVVFTPQTPSVSISPDVGGYVWAASNLNLIARVHGNSTNIPMTRSAVVSVFRDLVGQVWMSNVTHLDRMENGKRTRLTRLPTTSTTLTLDGVDVKLGGDKSGTLWAFAKGRGFVSLDGNSWKALKTPPEITNLAPNFAYTDSTGRIWIGFTNGEIATLENGRVTVYPAEVVRLKMITAIDVRGPQIWVSGSLGVALFKGGRFQQIESSDTESFAHVSGVVDAGSGGLWLNQRDGVLHIPADEVNRFIQDPSYRVHYDTFDSFDGLPGKSQLNPPYPTAIRGTDGRLWFVAQKGIAWVDPARISRNTLPPPVQVTAVLTDGSSQSNLANLHIPPLTSTVQLNYTALSFSVPERVRFRYRLDGIDKGWQDPGTRREAYYSHLSPGRYHFQVIACNNDGVWNETGATLDFRVMPAWYQTAAFRVTCVILVLCLVWNAYRLRVRHIAGVISARFDERLAERTRIAGDLHDTLLQTIQGSKLVANDALNKRSDEAKMRLALEQLSLWLEQATQEVRAAVNSLRDSTMLRNDLAAAFQRAAESGPAIGVLAATFSVIGTSREIHPILRDEIYRIGYEAIRNAQAHSDGTRLEVELRYGLDLGLRVRDNGVGIDPAVSACGRDGHFGLQGMRERAARIGARLIILSSPKSGTEILLTVPGAVAFIDATPAPASRLPAFFRRKTRTPKSK
ncbi:sensor histidine kinase [Acidicapsa ligni]|uniref:sensor histidine kinase n=1 Tax=Acidicapsa ligni TaxID=542300 RepID=UPI0021E004B5|nr:sensor histidine kinase [Acidicapsa ligni]